MSQSDNAISFLADDALDRRTAVEALEKLLTAPNLALPLVVGIYGGWGTGKTSVMRLLRRRLARIIRRGAWACGLEGSDRHSFRGVEDAVIGV